MASWLLSAEDHTRSNWVKCCMMTDRPIINAVAQPQCHLEQTEGSVASVAAHFPEQ